MNKEIFLRQLEQLLYDIPKEERDEAMDYYRGYFEDAGEEHETTVLEELESPQIIADSIKEALSSTGDMSGGLKNPPQVRENQAQSGRYAYGKSHTAGGQGYKSIFSQKDFQKKTDQQGSEYQQDQNKQGFGYQQDHEKQSSGYQQDDNRQNSGAAYRRYDQYHSSRGQAGPSGGADRWTKLLLLILLAIFTAPIWGAALSGVLGVAGVGIAVIVVLGVCSIGGVIGGIACTVTAIVRLCTLSLVKGLMLLGIGMLLIAASGVSMVLLLLLCGRFLPWALRQISALLRRLLQWGRSAA